MVLDKKIQLFDNLRVDRFPLLVDAVQLSKLLSFSVHTVRKWKAMGRIPFRKFGRSVRYDVQEVLEVISSKNWS